MDTRTTAVELEIHRCRAWRQAAKKPDEDPAHKWIGQAIPEGSVATVAK